MRSISLFRQLTLALLTGSALFLEIALTRLFSTLYFSPYVFAILSIAVLGLGLGAAGATLRLAWRAIARLPLYSALAGYATLLLLLTVVWSTPFDLGLALLIVVMPPYIFTGLALVTIFSANPADSPTLYRADLLGAGTGAIVAIPLLNGLGGLNSLWLVAALFGLAALLATLSNAQPGHTPRYGAASRRLLGLRPGLIAIILIGLSLLGLSANLIPATRWLTIDMARLTAAKPITGSLAAGGDILHTEWDAFARTDLVDPGQGRPYELYIDGAAGSVMPPAGELNLLRTDIGFFPFATQQPQQVMVIGPGGGLDVLFALSSRAASITAVEINPASVAIVEQFADYHGDLYGQPGVRLLVDEGRSVLRREATRYDLIYLSQVVTLAAERSGYALTENSIYTVEAFVDYLAHLRPGGQIAMKLYDELTLTRAVVTAATALSQERGLSETEAMRHLAVFLDPDAEPPIPLLIVQERPFERDEALSYAGVAAQVEFVPLFVPGVAGSAGLEAILNGQSTLADLVAESPSDVSATTDDRPFFYQFERGLPQSLQPLLWALGAILLIGLILLIISQRRIESPLARYSPLYFAALGLGFITIEIALIQQTRLFLGHPTLAVTTVLAVLLLGGGLGSQWAGRHLDAATGWLWPLVGIVGLALLWLLAWPWLSDLFFTGSTPLRVAVVSLTLLPLAFLMGMPFPLGLRAVGQEPNGDRHVALAWAVNGVLTVVGSAGAVAVAILAGFSSVLWGGVGAYGLAAAVVYFVSKQ